jgi:hypothetical protein
MKHFFAEEEALRQLSAMGDPLEKPDACIDWEIFRAPIEGAFKRDYSKRGRPPFDRLMMWKLLTLQRDYNISDDQAEFQIRDRATFKRFLGLELGDRIPDAKII